MADLSLEELERLDAEATAEEIGLDDSMSSDPSILDQVSGYLQQSPIGAVGTGALNAIALGQGDRVSAGLRSLIQDQSYTDALGDVRGITNQLQEEYPTASLAGNIGGNIGAGMLTGGASFIGARPLAYLYGGAGPAGLTGAQRYARAIGQGGLGGLLYGVGETDIEGVEPNASINSNDRVSKALTDSLMGAAYGVGGGVLGTAVGDVGEYSLRNILGTNLTPAQRQIAETLKDQSDESLLDAAEGITRANVQGQPLLLPEVLENNQLLDDAASIRAIAPNRQQIEDFLRGREEGAAQRISQKLTQELGVQPKEPLAAGRELADEYNSIIKYLEGAREAEVGPIYRESRLEDPNVAIERFGNFFVSPQGQQLYNQASKGYNVFKGADDLVQEIAKKEQLKKQSELLAEQVRIKNQPEGVKKLQEYLKPQGASSKKVEVSGNKKISEYVAPQKIEPIEVSKNASPKEVSPAVLQRVNELLNDEIQVQKLKYGGSTVSDLANMKKDLMEGIRENTPLLREATEKYAEKSKVIEDIQESAIGRIIKKVDDINANKALKIFDDQPENIEKARDLYVEYGRGHVFDMAARSHLENLINNLPKEKGKRAAKQLIKSKNTIEKLKAILGADDTKVNDISKRVSDFLETEAKMENFPQGSATASRGVLYKKLGVTPESSSEAVTTMGLLNRELKDSGGILGVARAALGLERRPNEKMIRELADMLLTPEGGTRSIEAILRNRNDRLSGTVGEGLRAGIMSGSRMPSAQEDLQYQLMEALRR